MGRRKMSEAETLESFCAWMSGMAPALYATAHDEWDLIAAAAGADVCRRVEKAPRAVRLRLDNLARDIRDYGPEASDITHKELNEITIALGVSPLTIERFKLTLHSLFFALFSWSIHPGHSFSRR